MRNAEVIRQWQVLREIEARRAGVTIHELARLVRVSSRTIRRDLQALQEAGFAVFDEGEENETKRWKLNIQPFRGLQDGLSVSDVAALYLSRALVETMSGWPLAAELHSAFEKIERSLNERMREFLGTLPQVLSAKGGPGAGAAGGALVDVTRRLLDATRARREVSMRYFSASNNRAKTYTVQPYRLALANGGVYLVAWVPAYNAFRTFAVGRIEKMTLADETFRRTHELPDNLFSQSMGVFWGEPERVELEFDANVAPYVRGRVWHESQEIRELDGGRLAVVLQVSNDWALRSWILGFGAGVRVVSPPALAASVLDEFSRGARLYAASPRAVQPGRSS
ncbi:MAG TPA: WYL domain-containing protein [Vicinamibacterales bacterium]|nr:WYL domain-containing protein [Vicinamibacterales bacterium]